MERFGISVDLKHIPPLDRTFFPILRFNQAFLSTAKKPISIAVERANGQIATCHTFIHGTTEMRDADHYYVNRLVKTILWMKGDFRIYVGGDQDIFQYLQKAFSADGVQAFDWDYMAHVFEHPFEVVSTECVPEPKDTPKAMGDHLNGCRIGFDAGGSDRKVSAVVNGTTVYSEEVVWFPKTTADPDYHYNGIVSALKSAAEHSLSPAEKLKVVQNLMENGDAEAAKIYESIGVYLGHTLAYYYDLYGYRYVLLLGRVMSGRDGDLILQTADSVLTDEYPQIVENFYIKLPDERFRRVGQSMAAASLPEITNL